MKDMQGYIVNNNSTTIIIIINSNITNDLWFFLLTLIDIDFYLHVH
jgi:hypothetical protein